MSTQIPKPIGLDKELDEIFHELSPKERMKAMRSTMNKIGREIRKQAVSDLKSLNYQTKPRHKGEKPGKNRAKALRTNIRLVPYRRRIGFHVTVASRKSRAGGHSKVDHFNRWWEWRPAARWLETGTEKQEPHPFMENAERKLDSYESRILEVFEQKVDEIVKKHNGG